MLYTVQPRLSELQGTSQKVRIIGILDNELILNLQYEHIIYNSNILLYLHNPQISYAIAHYT